ncbi:MAG: PSD1 and planctomycete cytochrome C domain-containing protein [Pirellulales bacterium]
MMRPVGYAIAGMLGAVLAASSGTRVARAAPDFERDVAPLLLRRCVACHDDTNASGGLSLVSAPRLTAGGDSGVVVHPGQPDDSYLLQRVDAGEMPPPRLGKSRQLPEAERQILREWVAAGAPWPAGRQLDLFERTTESRGGRDWWSFQPVRQPALPDAVPQDPDSQVAPRTAVDRWIRQSLLAQHLTAAPPAPPRLLLRRLTIDLTGLPPTAEELDEFADDPAPDAYERRVERLLASPRLGERWGRYWLDLVRYADTCGYERDQEKPLAWRYRDWVIQSINTDRPYDEFVRAQLAGDELESRSAADLIATGFLRLGTWNDEPNDPQEYKYERLEDLVHATSTAFLALTTKCARCHEHKFDPIPQVDYYRLAAAFWPGPIEPRGRELLGGPTRDELGAEVLGWTDISANPPPLRLLRKGDPTRPEQEVAPGFLSLLPQLNRPVAAPTAGSRTTQRRRQLADWIVDPRNPLTTRVAVNRLWLHHFGQALVRSPDNFGFTGQRPTHPELLDWLAAELVRGQWQLKPLHRLLVTSATYRQSSLHPRQDEFGQRDAGNQFWWRAERRRLEAELLRDALLYAAGSLDLRLGGPGVKPVISAEALEGLSRKSGAWQPSPAADQGRRSIYLYAQRSLLPPLLTTFDFVDTTQPCAQRDVSTVAPQALALLNNEFVHQQSASLAEWVETQAGEDETRGIAAAWRRALGRHPSASELQVARAHLAIQRRNFTADAPPQPAVPATLPVSAGLVLWLDAGRGVERDKAGRVQSWADQSGAGHPAMQSEPDRRPEWQATALAGQPAVHFDGRRRFLQLAGAVLTQPRVTVIGVVTDRGAAGHRELFSNWNGAAGNSVTSLFVGMTAEAAIRWSDDFSGVGRIEQPAQPFILTAIAGPGDAAVFQNARLVARKGSPLSPRQLQPPYVVGQQGNIDGEYWTGELAELLVYDRDLNESERLAVTSWLGNKYRVPVTPHPAITAQRRAWESLCHVLLNVNEFLYVD